MSIFVQNKNSIMKEGDVKFIEKCRDFAIGAHSSTNHLYDLEPYSVHLESVYFFALKYINLVAEPLRKYVLGASWTHDTIEDARMTYNDVKAVCGEDVAEITFALTNEKGKTREDRANDKYYLEMKLVPGADYVKICDRLANVKRSFKKKSTMLGKYRKEQDHFRAMLYRKEYDPMFKELEVMLFS